MRRPTLAALHDPARRPRLVMWAGVAVLALAAFIVVSFSATSTYWFCAEVCHKVQDDTIEAYQHSAHNKVSCMACHEPVNADPLTFTLRKVKALGELALTVSNNYELPLNAESHLALDAEEMGSEQCTQCHDLDARRITPSPGIIIDHEVHKANGVNCTTCHNRTAHVEDFDLALTDPATGEPNRKHEDFLLMEGCFRCHNHDGVAALGKSAPGECGVCHPAGFELKPANHAVAGFYTAGGESSGHWKLKEQQPGYCRICHDESTFCVDCHGVEMPHPADFVTGHGEVGKANAQACAACHARGVSGPEAAKVFCNACHHKGSDPTKPWIPQHVAAVRSAGAEPCFDCHSPTYCSGCHVKGGKQ